ncbi:hypothetical protein SAMN05216412_10693 [Nitrosospira multiformis]|uniref:Uncharacterized protein n=1 Tax=Nitrosospira multiformis TaxID=1231 RepID=A0A1I0EAL0_9PROT|nr:hypothetical protein SAMN05216412_10693 [Nitrosospira multiformis]
MSKILALTAYRASPHNNFFRYFSPFRNDFGNLRLWPEWAVHKRSRRGRNSPGQTRPLRFLQFSCRKLLQLQ